MLYRASTKRMDRKWPRSKAHTRFSERSQRYDSRWICTLSVLWGFSGTRLKIFRLGQRQTSCT